MALRSTYLGEYIYADYSPITNQFTIWSTYSPVWCVINLDPDTLGQLFNYATRCLAPDLDVTVERIDA
jgi:hypothetical protein